MAQTATAIVLPEETSSTSLVAVRGVEPLQRPRSNDGDRRRYMWPALRSPYALGLGGVTILAAPLGFWPVFLLGVALQLLLVLGLPRLRAFRDSVDEDAAIEERREALAARNEVLARISDEHRHRFERLEQLVEAVLIRIDHTRTVHSDLREASGLRSLLSSYLSLAIAHKAACIHLSTTNRAILSEEIEDLRTTVSQSPKLQALRAQRLAIVERRRERRDRTSVNLECIVQQMATLESIIHLTFETTAAAIDVDVAAFDLERVLAEFAAQRPILDDLVVGAGPESIDPRVFAVR
jgi:hypothetical protein